ncbi:MAG: hypothetical protein K0U74_01035 [Alphaproteobacteria bacterium]|nr:hypothetical protein [Alphaproteobacteria bacterium]
MARLFVVVLMLALVGCAGLPKPQISVSVRDQFHITKVVAVAPENSDIWWGDAERELADKQGVSFGDGGISQEEFAAKPETRAYVRQKLADLTQKAVAARVKGVLAGPKAARLKLSIRKIHIASAAQRVLIGGHHGLVVDAWLVDASNGAELTPRQMFTAIIGGGSGVAGVVTDQFINAVMKDPVYRLADQIGEKAKLWLVPSPT